MGMAEPVVTAALTAMAVLAAMGPLVPTALMALIQVTPEPTAAMVVPVAMGEPVVVVV